MLYHSCPDLHRSSFQLFGIHLVLDCIFGCLIEARIHNLHEPALEEADEVDCTWRC
jgi:hypothetical protein